MCKSTDQPTISEERRLRYFICLGVATDTLLHQYMYPINDKNEFKYFVNGYASALEKSKLSNDEIMDMRRKL